MECRMIFVLDNGTQLEGKEKIKENLHLFPDGILEKMKPVFEKTRDETTGWNTSIIAVYQNGNFNIKKNIPPGEPFSLDKVFK